MLNRYKKGDENRIDLINENFLSFILNNFNYLESLHNYKIFNFENIPTDKGFIIISNHSFFAYDMLFFMRKYNEKTGKFLRGLTDHTIFEIPILRNIFLQMGIIDGTMDNASRLLKSKNGLIIYPGGAREAMKSSLEKYQLDWQGRYGFIKLALINQIPIIPLISKGHDDTFKIFMDGYTLKFKNIPLPLFRPLKISKITHIVKKPVYLKNEFKDSLEEKLYIRRIQRSLKKIFEEELSLF